MHKINRPIARTTDIVVQETNDEILIYDLKTNKAFCLNETASIVWKYCDGKNSVTKISDEISKQKRELISEELVWFAIDELNNYGLLKNGSELENYFSGMSRREVVKKIGFSTIIALPIISSIVAPKVMMAQSGGGAIGDACGNPGNCTSGNCVNSTCCSATSTSSNGSGAFVGCGLDQAACSTSASTFCCSGTGTSGPGILNCGAGTPECTCD